ncbi:MAG: TIGR01777 family oxidoreductase [Phycisphaerales bacterium]
METNLRGKRVVIAGGRGFLGGILGEALRGRGAHLFSLTRSPRPGKEDEVAWDARSVGEWKQTLTGALAVVNLVGRSVDCIKNERNCKEIISSRVDATRAIGMALKEVDDPPCIWVQMSTAHAYGDPPDALCDENSPLGTGFAPEVASVWEGEHANWLSAGTRSVVLRTSFVLSRRGGALPTLERLARFGLGGKIGSGRQGLSWIHEKDITRLMKRAIADPTMSGMYVATAPTPVSMLDFMQELRRAVRMPLGLPSPAWMVRIGSMILRNDPELALLGRYCASKRLSEEGFRFSFPGLRSAFDSLYGPREQNSSDSKQPVNRPT